MTMFEFEDLRIGDHVKVIGTSTWAGAEGYVTSIGSQGSKRGSVVIQFETGEVNISYKCVKLIY